MAYLPDPSVNTSTTSAAPPSSNATSATAPVAPDVQPTAPSTNPLNGVVPAPQTTPPPPRGNAPGAQVPKQTFGGALAQGLQGPKYSVDENGNMVSDLPVKMASKGGVLGGILAGAILGAQRGISAPTSGSGKAGAFSAGAANAQKMGQEQDTRAREIAQQNFQNSQAAAKNKLENALTLGQTMHITQNMNFEADEHPGVMRSRDLANEAAEMGIRGGQQRLLQDSLDFQDHMAQLGIPGELFTEHGPELNNQIAPALKGSTQVIQNGQRGENNGVRIYPTSQLNQPITSPVSYRTYDGAVDRAGVPIPTEHLLTPDGQISGADFIKKYFAGRSQLYAMQTKIHDDMTAQTQKAALEKAQAEPGLVKGQTAEAYGQAAKGYGEGNKANAEATQLKREAADIAKPDVTGFTTPLSVKEYDKRYDAFSKSKDYQTLSTLTGSYQQFQDTLKDINAGKDMTGAQSVVGLFNAIGISATPLAGKGFRINSNTIQEHVGARGLDQSAYQKLLGLQNGDIITPQQLKDYASIAGNVYRNTYVNVAAEAHRQGLPADFLPRGGGQALDPITAQIYTRVVLQAHPDLAKDPAKLKQAIGAAAQSNGWTF